MHRSRTVAQVARRARRSPGHCPHGPPAAKERPPARATGRGFSAARAPPPLARRGGSRHARASPLAARETRSSLSRLRVARRSRRKMAAAREEYLAARPRGVFSSLYIDWKLRS
ncbi:hypothetical protein Dimus_031414 [Dionaea muscipula]